MLVLVNAYLTKQTIEYDYIFFGKLKHKIKEINDYENLFNNSTIICEENEVNSKLINLVNKLENMIKEDYNNKKYKNLHFYCDFKPKITKFQDMKIDKIFQYLTPFQFKQEFGYLIKE